MSTPTASGQTWQGCAFYSGLT